MVVTTTLDRGLGLVNGDAISIRRTVNNIPVGDSVAKAYLTVKTAIADADGAAKIQKAITTANVAGTGQIEDDGTADQSAVLRFDLTNANTVGTNVTADLAYFYDIQIILTTNGTYTIEKGTAAWVAQVTLATT